MQRSRTGPPNTPSETSVASLPDAPAPLEVLLQAARAPDAARPEVDALIAGMAQPLAPEQSPRERADLLLSLIEDRHLGDFSGSRGQTVRSAAVQALLALGYPYALEVPPEALEGRSARRSDSTPDTVAPKGLFTSGKGWAGFSIVLLIGTAQLIPMLLLTSGMRKYSEFSLWAGGFITVTTFLPLALVTLGHVLPKPALRNAGSVWLIVVSFLYLLLGIIVLMNSVVGLVPLVAGLLLIAGTALMDSAAEDK
ncbi:MAG TPA: hypothetical protein VF815_33095 [Myxococcaceae bacterium]